MLHIEISLILNEKDHIKLLLDTVKKYKINNPVYIVELPESVQVSFETDYQQYELIKEFAGQFPDHELTDDIDSGQEDILPIAAPNHKFWVLFGDEIKTYEIFVVPGHVPDTGEKGFLVVKDDPKVNHESEIISRLQKNRTQAFWEAYRLKQRQIEQDYQNFQLQQKKKRRSNKTT